MVCAWFSKITHESKNVHFHIDTQTVLAMPQKQKVHKQIVTRTINSKNLESSLTNPEQGQSPLGSPLL